MRRRLGFWVSRTADLRVAGPVIDLAARRPDIEAVVLVPGWSIGRDYYAVEPGTLHALFGSALPVTVLEAPTKLGDAISAAGLETMVTVLPRISDIPTAVAEDTRGRSRARGVRWAALPYAYHQDYLCAVEPERLVRDWNLVATLGPRSLEIVDAELATAPPSLRRALRDRLVPIGYPELDVIGTLDREAILAKHDLPSNRPIILVSTANTFRSHEASDRGAAALEARFRGWRPLSRRALKAIPFALAGGPIIPYRTYLARMRALANANGAWLVAKSRTKHDDPSYVNDYVDRVVSDVGFYPATTLELLAVASLSLSFISMTALEAIACERYAITACQLPLDRVLDPVSARFGRLYVTGPDSFGDARGTSEVIDGTTRAGATRLEKIAQSPLHDFHPDGAAREAVLDRFLGVRGKSAAAFLDAVMSL
jgi:hypothetical protein